MKKIVLIVCIFSFLIACNQSSNQKALDLKDIATEQEPASQKSAGLQSRKNENEQSPVDRPPAPKIPPANNAASNDWDKKIIKTAELKIEVKDFNAFADFVHNSTRQYGGYIANEEQNQSDEKIESVISIKVPVDQFEPLLNQLPSKDSKVIEKKIYTADVTGEVVDVKSRLQAKEQMRLKYLEFLKQSKNMQDVLSVQKEVNNIQEEIESASARLNYLSHQSAFSTINLTFYQPLPGYTPDDKTPTFSYRIIESFKTGLNFISEIFIGIISIWPILFIIFVIILVYKKRHARLTVSKQRL